MAGKARAYESPLRRAQVDRTREQIIESFVDQLSQPGRVDLSAGEAAQAAGVSLRTVYNHFPNQAAQLDGVARWLDSRIVGDVEPPRVAADLPGFARRIHVAAGQNLALVRAQMTPGVARTIRRERRRTRMKAIEEAIAPISEADETTTRDAAALVNHLTSAEAGLSLLDEHGVPPERAGAIVALAIRGILRELSEQHTATT